ncbi:hypothetical protein N185_34540 [Sinorhizobium sp. GW3]|nr:hypothetical protein N185_34540 [Sinorhizobium sp. GW3]
MRFGAKCHVAVAWLLVFVVPFLPAGSFAAEKERIVVTGASTMAPLVAEIAKRYEEKESEIQIDVQTGGSARGVSDLRRNLSDIGLVSRDLSSEERDLVAVTLAYDGVAMLVHKSNPISRLSDDQIRGIYTGEITDWKELGKGQGPITVVSKADGRSTLEVFLTYLRLRAKQVKAHIVIGDNEQAVKIVQNNPLAIGYVSIGTIEYHVSVGTEIKAIPIGPVEATSANVLNGTYSVRRPLNIVFKPAHSQTVEKFIAYATGRNSNGIIIDYFFIPASD